MTDIQNDTDFALLKEASAGMPVKIVKIIHREKASLDELDYDDLMDVSFADEKNRRFPIFSPGQAVASMMYMKKQKSAIPEETMDSCKRQLALFGLKEAIHILEREEDEELEKEAAETVEYLISSRQKLPVADREMLTKSASVFVANLHQVGVRERMEGSAQLVKLSKEYGEEVMDNRIKSYAFQADCDLIKTASAIKERILSVETADREGYQYLYDQLTKIANDTGHVQTDSNVKKDIANSLLDLDGESGMLGAFDPILDVYNSPYDSVIEKTAAETIEIDGIEVEAGKITSMTASDVEFVVGSEVADDISDQDKITKVARFIESAPDTVKVKIFEHLSNRDGGL